MHRVRSFLVAPLLLMASLALLGACSSDSSSDAADATAEETATADVSPSVDPTATADAAPTLESTPTPTAPAATEATSTIGAAPSASATSTTEASATPTSTSSPTSTATASSAATATATGGAPAVRETEIEDTSFIEPNITVAAGTTVEWKNRDAVVHTVTFDDGSVDSGFLLEDQRFSHTFATAGVFPYFCTVHPFMQGTVTVQ